MRIRFWGTRGSLARPGPATVRYGGNTSCVQVEAPDGTLIVLDCGTGAHDLGQHLITAGPHPLRAHLLLTHTHWDHIQGFPFFAPLFVPDNEWDVYAPQGLSQRIEATLAGQMEYEYFPVRLAQMGATIRYHDLEEGAFALGGVQVSTRYLNHPGLALAYRLEMGGASVVYATDHEPHSLHATGATGPVHREDQRHIEFLTGAQLLIHDAQYTLEEYAHKHHWGHSPAERVVDFAVAARVERLALYHHDPQRSDDALDRLVETCRRRAAAAGSTVDVFAACEGQVIELNGRAAAAAAAGRTATAATSGAAAATGAMTVLIVDDDPGMIELLTATLEPEGFRLVIAGNGDTALAVAHVAHPDLVLLDWSLPGRSGLEICRALRADADAKLRQVPVVMLTGQVEAEHTAAGFAAGVDDYVTKPFKPTYLRARVHAWLIRGRTGATGNG